MQSIRPMIAPLACALVFMSVARPALADNDKQKSAVTHYTVQDEDTLGSIALQFGVDVDAVRAWNDLSGVDVPAGKDLVVKSDEKPDTQPSRPLPVIHVIRRGDTLEDIAHEYHVSLNNVKRWNRRLDPRRLQIGQRIRLYVPGRGGQSVSWGRASGGRLYNGVALKDCQGLDVRSVARSYATKRTRRLLKAAAADVQARWPDAPDLVVGDMSYKRGGHMGPHASHQSGRDADISYYYRGNVQLPNLYEMTPKTLDAVKTWHLLKTLIDTGKVQYIFMVRPLQRVLYEYARSIGYTKQQLSRLIQYPRSIHDREGIIRYAHGHDSHFHIRFTCGPLDRHCH